MRVLIIAQYFPPDMGGGATRAYNVAKGLQINGCDVIVVSAFPHYPDGNIPKKYRWKPLKIEVYKGIKVIRTIVPPLASRGLARRIALFLSFMISSLFALPLLRRIDVIWAANPNVLSIFPALIYRMALRCPVALNVDDLWPEDLYNFNLIGRDSLLFRVGTFLARIAYSKAKLITPISPGYIKILTDRYGIHNDKIVVVRAGVDYNTFGIGSRRRRHGNKFIILYSGAFSVAYDFDQVLMAAKLLESYSDIEFVVQGGGELLTSVKDKISSENLKNIKIIDRILSREEVAKMLSEADALLLPLRDFGRPYLGISSKLYEYQASGKPIICCAEGEPARYVRETKSGLVVRPGDYKALADAILYLKNNPDLANKMGANGRKYVEKNLKITKIGERLHNFFSKLISEA